MAQFDIWNFEKTVSAHCYIDEASQLVIDADPTQFTSIRCEECQERILIPTPEILIPIPLLTKDGKEQNPDVNGLEIQGFSHKSCYERAQITIVRKFRDYCETKGNPIDLMLPLWTPKECTTIIWMKEGRIMDI